MALRYKLDTKIPLISFEIIDLDENYSFKHSYKKSRNAAARKPSYTAVFRQDCAIFLAATQHPAETIGRLNQKFFGRRAETIFRLPRP
jgi:hypothetical protein